MGLFDIFKKNDNEPEWIKTMPKELVQLLLSETENNPQACKLDEIPHGFGKFGIDKTNPIPAYGVPENEIYLARLRLNNGDRIRWRRIGSTKVENIEKPVDEYEIFNLDGDTISLLYISPYHFKTSIKAPIGFRIN